MMFKSIRVLFIGPIFKISGEYTGMPGMLIRAFLKEGAIVNSASGYRNKIIRMLDILITVFLKRKKTDLIFLQSFGQLAFIMEDFVSQLAYKLKIPICFTLHGGAFYDFYKKYPKWVTKVLIRASKINTPSCFLKEKFEKEGFKINYIPNFINLDNFPYKRNITHQNSLLWVRAFHHIYNPELAIEIVRALKPKIPDILLTMIGPDQGKLKECKSLLWKYELNDNINIIGPVNNLELFNYYQGNKIFLTTTRFESFGVSLIEAASCGTPCVSVAVGEIPYIWHDRENIILAKRDPNDFAIKIIELLNDENLYLKVSSAAKLNSERFTWANVKDQWLNSINEINK